jgi:class 3 adenylate cyclase/tetratricopeptide (TPR) repeat protein
VLTCPNCGQENPDGFRFCGACAAPLTEEASVPREERKVVTVLFCDLVGSTARAERMDPEDVRALLSSYHERVRAELERFGGTVEKFVGDAVMALFGAPTAHEDDPERAARAALAIREWAQEESDLQVRIGITTGEALVTLSANAQAGEGMASGDVVNTAARLQTAAPVNGIVVDETTFRASRGTIDCREAAPVQARGKAEPVTVWEVLEARARLGVDIAQRGGAELVGRREELDLLVNALARVRREREAQLITVVGVPGIGKSRLVYELFQAIEGGRDLTHWRQGGALPYGDGVAFWPLAEIAKAHAGILETDSAEVAAAKLERAVAEELADDPEAKWVEEHLRPLVGLEAESELGGDRRGEAFAAWRRLFEAIAERRPLVLVFDDLHWADDGMLDFVDHLAGWASGVPLLVVCTARPELLERRPDWGAGKPNSATVSLSPLSESDTALLIHALLEQEVLPAEVQATLLSRAGGNPLYAAEFVRMASELGVERDLPVPESIQGLIAARLDLLSDGEKSLLQDAAVIGAVFWLGTVTSMGSRDRAQAGERLHALETKDFIRRARRSSVVGETEYAFRHVLIRDVAYGQIPRADRAEKHRLAATWIESLTPDRTEDHAEMLAHHYVSALEYARAAGRPTNELAGPARSALREAGDRASAVYAFAAAVRFYDAALELWSDEEPGRPQLLLRYGRALWAADTGGLETLLEASDELVASGDHESAAEAEVLLARIEWFRGHRDRADSHLERAADLVKDAPRSRSKAVVLGALTRFHLLAAAYEDTIRVGSEGLSLAEELGLDEVRADILMSVGVARWRNGDFAGIADVERSVEIAQAANSPTAIRGSNHLGFALFCMGEVERSSKLVDQAVRLAEHFGDIVQGRFISAGPKRVLQIRQGGWDDALEFANELVEEAERGSPYYHEAECRVTRAQIRLARGDLEDVLADCDRALELSRAAKDPQQLVPVLAGCARVFVETDRMKEAAALADELSGLTSRYRATWELCDIAVALVGLGRTDELRVAVDDAQGTRWADALQHYIAGEFERAADVFADMSVPRDEADARLLAAEKLVGEGRRSEADEQLQRVLAFYRSVGATRYVREAEALLASATVHDLGLNDASSNVT